MIYHIMFKDKVIADVTREKNLITKIQKYVPDSPIQPFWGQMENMSQQWLTTRFYKFLKDRCYEDGRADLPVILEQAGLENNNPYEFVKISHGVTYEDFFWIKFDDEEIKWDDVKVRE